jgi:T4 superinfection immunity protein
VIDTVLGFAIVVLMLALGLVLYLLPVVVGALRHVPDLGSIAVLNLLLGWTALGWVIALALALRTVTPPGPLVQVVQEFPPPQPPLPPPDWSEPPGPPLQLPPVIPPRRPDDPATGWED